MFLLRCLRAFRSSVSHITLSRSLAVNMLGGEERIDPEMQLSAVYSALTVCEVPRSLRGFLTLLVCLDLYSQRLLCDFAFCHAKMKMHALCVMYNASVLHF